MHRLITIQLVAIVVITLLTAISEAADNNEPIKKPWYIKTEVDGKNVTCLLASFDADIVHKFNGTAQEVISIGDNAYLESNQSYCGTNMARLTIHWNISESKSAAFSILFNKRTDNELIIDQIYVQYYLKQSNSAEQFKSLKTDDSPHDFDKFRVKSKYSYKCEKGESIGFDVSDGITSIKFRNAQWEVFRDSAKNKEDEWRKFVNTPKKCDEDTELNNAILVVASICVAVLTVIVIAFVVIGRIRSRRNAKSFGVRETSK